MAAETPKAAAADFSRPPAVRPTKPNYNLLHKDPLPLKIDALPPLIPHNPLSLLTIAWVYVRSYLRPTKQPLYQGFFSPETRSVHVVDPVAIRAIWESGFFGKGTLSRSEPTWLNRDKKRRGIIVGETSEDATRRRRQERAEFKKERARKEREEIEATLNRERAAATGFEANESDATDVNRAEAAVAAEEPASSLQQNGKLLKDDSLVSDVAPIAPMTHTVHAMDDEVVDLEHLQLSLEEAFFLVFALDVLGIRTQPQSQDDPTSEPIPRELIFDLFQAHCGFVHVPVPNGPPPANNYFLANYAVYHHFRSLGWVIRPGTKFAVDWMLYNRGPVFSHAEFAVITVPSFSHPLWKKEGNDRDSARKRSWHWLHMVNRVQSQVRKTLVLAFVEMPPPSLETNHNIDPVHVLSNMKVREIVLKRWIPNRNRD